MKTVLTRLAATAAVAAAFALPGAASAATFLQNWYLDADGAGGDSAIKVGEWLDIVGASYIQLTPTGASTFSFKDDGVFYVSGHDNVPWNNSLNQITATFTDAAGTGTFGGAINFTSGVGILNVYSDSNYNYGTTDAIYGANDGTRIGTFVLSVGTGKVDTTGVPNGELTLTLQATDLAAGYFFAPDGTTDLSTLVSDGLLFGFVTTNASRVTNPLDPLTGELGELVEGTIVNNPNQGSFIVSNNGQYRLSTVPEPGVAALLGLGLIGVCFAGRRRRAS